MDFETAVRRRILDDAAVNAIIGVHADGGKSIDATVRRQGAPLPAIVITLVADPRPRLADEPDPIRPTRMRLRVLAMTREAVKALREAAIAALEPEGAFHGHWFAPAEVALIADSSGPADDAFIFADTIDLIFWHRQLT